MAGAIASPTPNQPGTYGYPGLLPDYVHRPDVMYGNMFPQTQSRLDSRFGWNPVQLPEDRWYRPPTYFYNVDPSTNPYIPGGNGPGTNPPSIPGGTPASGVPGIDLSQIPPGQLQGGGGTNPQPLPTPPPGVLYGPQQPTLIGGGGTNPQPLPAPPPASFTRSQTQGQPAPLPQAPSGILTTAPGTNPQYLNPADVPWYRTYPSLPQVPQIALPQRQVVPPIVDPYGYNPSTGGGGYVPPPADGGGTTPPPSGGGGGNCGPEPPNGTGAWDMWMRCIMGLNY